MLFANGYRYHMRSIGGPMSLDGYGLSNGYFGRYKHSINIINNCNLYTNTSARRSGGSLHCRRIRSRSRRVPNDQGRFDSSSNVFTTLRNIFFADSNTTYDGADPMNTHNARIILPGVLPLVSRKCLISMTSALFLLLFLGVILTMVGAVYFQRGNHPISLKDNIHQLLSIIAIICGIIMLLSCGVLFRILFCKGRWNYTSGRQRLVVTSRSFSPPNNISSNLNEMIINSNNEEEFLPNWSFNSQDAESNLRDEPPTYSECNTCNNNLQSHINLLAFTSNIHCTNTAVQPPPKYSSDPPPPYSQLDVRTLMVVISLNESTQEDNVSFRDNAQESPLPAIESISSPNNNLNEIDSEHMLIIEDYKPC